MRSAYKAVLLFVAIWIPYLGLVFYLAGLHQKMLPIWARWTLPSYFLAGIFVFTIVASRLKRNPQNSLLSSEEQNRGLPEQRRQRLLKRLLRRYLILFPFAVAIALMQRELPIKFALLALLVPILIIIVLWRSLNRSQAADRGTLS